MNHTIRIPRCDSPKKNNIRWHLIHFVHWRRAHTKCGICKVLKNVFYNFKNCQQKASFWLATWKRKVVQVFQVAASSAASNFPTEKRDFFSETAAEEFHSTLLFDSMSLCHLSFEFYYGSRHNQTALRPLRVVWLESGGECPLWKEKIKSRSVKPFEFEWRAYWISTGWISAYTERCALFSRCPGQSERFWMPALYGNQKHSQRGLSLSHCSPVFGLIKGFLSSAPKSVRQFPFLGQWTVRMKRFWAKRREKQLFYCINFGVLCTRLCGSAIEFR